MADWFAFPGVDFCERGRESVRLVFQLEHAHSGPWKETKGSQGQARLENEGRVIDQTLPGCSCGGEGGEQKGGTLLLLLPVVLVVMGWRGGG